jgi:hypothetical protein
MLESRPALVSLEALLAGSPRAENVPTSQPLPRKARLPQKGLYTQQGINAWYREFEVRQKGVFDIGPWLTNPQPTPAEETIEGDVRRLVAWSPSEELTRSVVHALRGVGRGILRLALADGVRMVLIPSQLATTQLLLNGVPVVAPTGHSNDGREWDVVRGMYLLNPRVMLMAEETLLTRQTPVHEIGHAVDHAISRDRDSLSAALWKQAHPRRRAFVSAYAQSNHREYFAVCFERWFNGRGAELRQVDPTMADYMAELQAWSERE